MNEAQKLIDFTNPAHLKVALLAQGISIESQAVFASSLYAENQFPYGYSNEEVKQYPSVPAELILPQDVYCGLHLKKESPWKLSIKNHAFGLWYKDKLVAPVDFVPRPQFYGKQLSTGQLCEKVAVLYGNKHILSFFTRGYCYYFSIGKQCKFCSLNPTRNSLGKHNELFIKPSVAQEAAQLAFQNSNDIRYVNHCSGTHKDNNLGLQFQIDVLKAIAAVTPKGVKQHMLTMPPDNLDMLEDLKKAGLHTVNFALEVFDKKKFEVICKGKHTLYGRNKFFEAFKNAVSVFGNGNSYCNFVGGLEPVESMIEGFEYLASIGVVPSINVFHPDPQSAFHDRKPPTINYLLRMARAQGKIYQKNKFKPIYPVGGTRNSLDTEVWRGFFN